MTNFITTDTGDRVAYDLRGTGPGLIFVAGAGPFRAIDPWTTETAERAAQQGIRTLVYDRLGRGESSADGRLSLERELSAIRALLNLLGGSGVLCGHSSGCSISLYAAAAGLPIGGLALWEAPVAGTTNETQAWSDEIEQRIDANDFEGATSHYMKDMPPEWLAEAKGSPQWSAIAASVVSQRADAVSLAWAVSALENKSLNSLKIPVLTMYGTETFPEMPEAASRIVKIIPGAREKEMPGSQHMWEPEAMAGELASFVKSC
jgi:pimeloyl-ACP methyl ester carboxylesterase